MADEDLITPAMVKKITYLMHKYADQRQEDFTEIQKKCRKKFAYENLAKMPVDEGHEMITKLIELTGGEEEQPQIKPESTGAHVTDDGTEHIPIEQEHKGDFVPDQEDYITWNLLLSVRNAVGITLSEVVNKDVPVQGLGGFVLELAKIIFEAKMATEVNNNV